MFQKRKSKSEQMNGTFSRRWWKIRAASDVSLSEGDGPCKDVDGDDVNVTGVSVSDGASEGGDVTREQQKLRE